MRKPLYPINVWAYQANAWRLFTFCQNIYEALICAKKLPFTPVVLSSRRELSFVEDQLSEREFGELASEKQLIEVLA